MLLINSTIGAALMIAFLGFIGYWLKEIPLTIIMVLVVGLLIRDIRDELRADKK